MPLLERKCIGPICRVTQLKIDHERVIQGKQQIGTVVYEAGVGVTHLPGGRVQIRDMAEEVPVTIVSPEEINFTHKKRGREHNIKYKEVFIRRSQRDAQLTLESILPLLQQ